MTNNDRDDNAGIAFALVCGAGSATAIGASVVFFPSLVKLASKRVLASSLGFSAGVMAYVSFVEIFAKSYISFEEGGINKSDSYIYATLCFFLGCAIMVMLNLIILRLGGHHHDAAEDEVHKQQAHNVAASPCMGCADDPVADLNEWHEQAKKEEIQRRANETVAVSHSSSKPGSDECIEDVREEEQTKVSIVVGGPDDVDTAKEADKKLIRMGVNTAVAIALHNFPEGLATFVATLDDPSVGAVLAVAIGIHNIPEGLCVALPLYYANGNRLKAFSWGVLSGLTEPLAALIGWLFLADRFTPQLYGVMFGIVSGMMVVISLKELIPTAHRYDPQDTVVTYSAILGMGVMALSICLFLI